MKQWKVKTIGEYDEDFGTEPAYYVIDSDSLHIADLCHYAWEENKANARLIAAAPDLLEACRAGAIALAEAEIRDTDLARIYAMMNTAIAKAEGK